MNASIQNKPARNLLLTALVTLGTLTFASVASADHDYLRRDFELRRIDLDQDYKSRRDANKFSYYRERDALQAARRRAQRIDCRDTRSARIKAINRDLSALSRDYHRTNRSITSWYNNSKSTLRSNYDAQVRYARRAARPVVDTVISRAHPGDCTCSVCVPVVERPIIVERPPVVIERPVPHRHPHHHPANCDCNICAPPVPPVDICPTRGGFRDGYRDGYYNDPYRDQGFTPANYRRKPNALDWASLILNLMD